MKNIAIIPARGGSKGLPKKNIKQIAGYPLIQWSIKQALEAEGVDDVFVSTDSAEIAQIAERSGAKVPFLRPEKLALDESTTESVMSHFGDWLIQNKIECDSLILLQPTSPIRLKGTLQSAIRQFEQAEADSLLAVSKSHRFFWKKEASGEVKASYDYFNRPRRQDIKGDDINYMETGSIYISKFADFMKRKNRLFGQIELFIMNEIEALEIDSQDDFDMCEVILHKLEGKI